MRKLLASLLCVSLLLAVGCAAVDVLPEKNRSANFIPTTKHLDLGGTVFFYADLNGDIEKLTAFVTTVLDEIKKENPDPDLDKIDLPKLVALLGFNQIQAVGLSSYQDGAIFHNKGFLYHPAAKAGFLRLLGDKSRPFETPNWAPADADLVFEQDYNLHGAFHVVVSMLREVMGAKVDELLAELKKPIPQLHVTALQIIKELDTRVVGVVRIHEDQMISLPDEEIEFPYTEMAIGVDGLGFVFDDLVESFGAMPMIKVTAAEDFHSIEMGQPLPGSLAVFAPVLAKEKKTGRIYVATSLKLLREFVAGPKALGKSKVFALASRGLPKSGSGMTFVSDKFVGKVIGWMTRMAEKKEEVKSMLGVFGAIMPETGIPMASCNGMVPDGMFFASNSSASHKATILTLGYANPMMIGILAAVAIPAFIDYKRKSEAIGAIGPIEAQELRKAQEELDKAIEAKPEAAQPAPPPPPKPVPAKKPKSPKGK
ncbi:MAG: hypothetical protein JRF33_22505 [Deltaproteobacteria bacterium]|nr:hypothetical protein [Deltaproteobacteria bacterium]